MEVRLLAIEISLVVVKLYYDITGTIVTQQSLHLQESDFESLNPEFTLSYTTTGGPATTVTWTRDTETVTDGTSTVLEDSVTAEYTHTLNVTGRHGGVYQCTVSNDKPSSTSSNITVLGK